MNKNMNSDVHHHRRPVALANWKMAMTISESHDFVKKFRAAVDNLVQLMDVILCPPFTALYPLCQELADSSVELGAQNLWAAPDESHTGEISARLLADAGCKWVMLGHWEVRRRTGETDTDVNAKLQAAFKNNLIPVLFIGEGLEEKDNARDVLGARLPMLFSACEPNEVSRSIVLYEPEWAIGAVTPASADHIAQCCFFIRDWIRKRYGNGVAEATRVIYGGSVTPQQSRSLLALPDVDGLGAGRTGRDPVAFAQIVREIAYSKDLI